MHNIESNLNKEVKPMNIFVLNCGSSSLKFQILEVDTTTIKNDSEKLLCRGVIERIGSQSLITVKVSGKKSIKTASPLRSHSEAIRWILDWVSSDKNDLNTIKSLSDIHAVGHRVVHGGEKFQASALITESVMDGIEECIELAPLHNPANISGIKAITKLLGTNISQVAVFDTAFHSTMPPSSYIYAIPYQFYRRYKVRKYGFHGTSHRYIGYRYRTIKKIEKKQTSIITLHLGNGCSACAIKNGTSIDTSMGMTPLEGLVMGTRSGDVDPMILDYINHKEGISIDQTLAMLNKSSGLLGISGLTNDMRELIDEYEENKDRRAKLAIDIFCERIKKYIGSYLASMNGATAIVFTGGIGENSAFIRERVIKDMEVFGIELDNKTNNSTIGTEALISSKSSKIEVYVIPTNEELLIARDTFRAIN